MLVAFRVGNYRSIRDQQGLNFMATVMNDGSAIPLQQRSAGTLKVVPAIALYGPNASGKSNVLLALADFQRMLIGETPAGWRLSGLPHLPFRLNSTCLDLPSKFEVEFVVDQIRYEYGIEVKAAVIQREWLHAFPHGRRQTWFLRDGPRGEYRFPGEHLKGARGKLTELTAPDVPFIVVGGFARHPQLDPLVDFFRRFNYLGTVERTAHTSYPARIASELAPVWGPRLADLASRADLGVAGAELTEGVNRGETSHQVWLRHVGSDGDGVPFSPYDESDGTRTWLWLVQAVLSTLDDGGVLIVDELDTSLHSDLAAEVVRMFTAADVNPHRAQLIFTTHDTSLLEAPYGARVLDRDQVWLTEKSRDGATSLFPVSAFKPRRQENLARGYRLGRYRAVPDLSPGELGRVIWLGREPASGDAA